MRKSAQINDIRVKLSRHFFADYFCVFFNEITRSGTFSLILKNSDITAILKINFIGSR